MMNDKIWIAVAVVLTALVADRIGISIRNNKNKDCLTLEPVHCLLFSSAIVLGPVFAAIIGAVAGVYRIFSRATPLTVIYKSIQIILRPAVASFAAAFVFMVTGGDVFRPYSVSSVMPAFFAALAYTLALGIFPVSKDSKTDLFSIKKIAGWSTGFTTGYILAVIYSVAPSYILVPVVVSAGLIRLSICKSTAVDKPQIVSVSANESKPVEDSQFIDPVTGLASKRYLEMFLSREIGRAARKETHIAVAVFNLDSAERLAQDELDAALFDMGERLRSGVRNYDIVARYSQQRIIVVLPEAHPEQAMEVAERLRRSASPVKAGKMDMAVSVGLSIYPDHGHNPEELINSAHYALNRGRFNGSEKVHIFKNLAKAG